MAPMITFGVPLTDDSLMPFGKHRGTKMERVPANYLLWLVEEMRRHRLPTNPKHEADQNDVAAYVNANRDALEKEAEEQRRD